MLFFGLVFLGLTVFCGLRYAKLKKTMEPVVPDESDDQVQNGGRDSLNGEITPRTGLLSNQNKGDGGASSSDAEFDKDQPAMQKQDRVFNLHGQGKPIAELSHHT